MRTNTKLWTTNDGRRLRICDMTDDHLLNTIRLLQRFAEAERIKSTVFYATCTPPESDGALDCFNREFDAVMDSTYEDYVSSIYCNLVDDARRRGLVVPEQSRRIDVEAKLVLARMK